MATSVLRSGAGLSLLLSCHCSSFQKEKLYFYCQAMKCLRMTAEHTTINLTVVELTGQKPMQPLLGTEHYQCMDSLFIRGSIRHRSLCHCAGYEKDSSSTVPHITMFTQEQSGGDNVEKKHMLQQYRNILAFQTIVILVKPL